MTPFHSERIVSLLDVDKHASTGNNADQSGDSSKDQSQKFKFELTNSDLTEDQKSRLLSMLYVYGNTDFL